MILLLFLLERIENNFLWEQVSILRPMPGKERKKKKDKNLRVVWLGLSER